jgi:hypothetical protein
LYPSNFGLQVQTGVLAGSHWAPFAPSNTQRPQGNGIL